MSRRFGWREQDPNQPVAGEGVRPAVEPPPAASQQYQPAAWPEASAPQADTSAFATPETTGRVATAPPATYPATPAGTAAYPAPATTRRRASAPAASSTVVAPRGGYRLGELVWLCLAVVDAFLGLDFLFRAVAVSNSGFVAVVVRVGDALASPFAGIFARASLPQVDHTTFWAALLAIVVYTVAAWVLLRLVRLLAGPSYRRARSS